MIACEVEHRTFASMNFLKSEILNLKLAVTSTTAEMEMSKEDHHGSRMKENVRKSKLTRMQEIEAMNDRIEALELENEGIKSDANKQRMNLKQSKRRNKRLEADIAAINTKKTRYVHEVDALKKENVRLQIRTW